jgi:hypothetical protein
MTCARACVCVRVCVCVCVCVFVCVLVGVCWRGVVLLGFFMSTFRHWMVVQVAICLGYTTRTKKKALQGVYGVKVRH